jgi:hypothetical protein
MRGLPGSGEGRKKESGGEKQAKSHEKVLSGGRDSIRLGPLLRGRSARGRTILRAGRVIPVMTSQRKIAVTEKNLQKAAERVLLRSPLVTVEVDYLRRRLGNTATQVEMDAKVAEVRKTPWSELMA